MLWFFLWRAKGLISDHFCLEFKARGVSPDKLDYFYGIFNGVSPTNKFPILSFENNLKLHITKVHKVFDSLRFTHILVKGNTVSGNYVCSFNKIKIVVGINIFSCKKGGYILSKYVCDGISDCPNDSSDESMCVCDKKHYGKSKNNICMIMQRRHNIAYCTQNYFMDITGTCKKYAFSIITIEKKSQMRESNNMKKFVCNNGKILAISLVNNLISDCGLNSEVSPSC